MRRMAIAAAIMLATILQSPGSASAWEQQPCTSGSLLAAGTAYGRFPAPDVIIPGVVDCVESTKGAQFAVVIFEAGRDYGYYYRDLLHAYTSPVEATEFKLEGRVMMANHVVHTGLCLMPDESTLLSCVQFTSDRAVKPLSTSDPLVTGKEVKEVPPEGGQNPNCGTCWRLL